MSGDPYNAAVRKHFANPLHAGVLQPRYPDVVTAEAGESDSAFRVVLGAELDGRVMRRLRYRVFGCPHLIAAAELACARLEGSTVESLRELSVAELMERLEVPVEKTGRMLLLEDAARLLAAAVQDIIGRGQADENSPGEPTGI
jgi:NifU-like protein involved in Fe-S cluster formation